MKFLMNWVGFEDGFFMLMTNTKRIIIILQLEKLFFIKHQKQNGIFIPTTTENLKYQLQMDHIEDGY